MRSQPAHMRYLLLFLPSMMAYAIALIVVGRLVKTHELSQFVEVLLALLPTVPILVGAYAIVRLMREMDEFMRSRLAFHLMVGLGAGVLTTFTYGLTEVIADMPRLRIYWTLPISLGCVGLSQLLEYLRGGAGGIR